MRQDKNLALKMRLEGRSYSEIQKELKIPKSTLSGWLSRTKLSPKAQEKISQRAYKKSVKALVKRNKNQTIIARQSAEFIKNQTAKEIKKLNDYELKLVGAALYWAEGYKRQIIHLDKPRTHHPVALTNSDPLMVKAFMNFLINVCEVPKDKIKADVRLYKHMHSEKVLNFWKNITGLPQKNFGKIYVGVSKSSQGIRPFNRLPFGTIMIRVNNTKLFYKIMGWIDGLKNQKNFKN